MGLIHLKKIAGQNSRATVPLKEGTWPEIAESCGIAEVKFAIPQSI